MGNWPGWKSAAMLLRYLKASLSANPTPDDDGLPSLAAHAKRPAARPQLSRFLGRLAPPGLRPRATFSYTLPPLITNTARPAAYTSLSGSPSKPTISACVPGAMEPISLARFNDSAESEVAEISACIGSCPPSDSYDEFAIVLPVSPGIGI